MTREELAAQIFAFTCFQGGSPCRDAFEQADKFLAYAAAQRTAKEEMQQREKAGNTQNAEYDSKGNLTKVKGECEHKWISGPEGQDAHCLKCGSPKVKPEPPKPERVAREWLLTIPNASMPWNIKEFREKNQCHFQDEVVRVREILPGDEK